MMSVILIDDERLELDLMEHHVNWEGLGLYVAGTAKNGAEGLALYQAARPDFIVTDIKMPVMDGLSLIHRIRAQDAATEFVIVSGHDDFAFAKQALQLNVSDYILKPIYISEFEALLGRMAENRLLNRNRAAKLERALIDFIDEGLRNQMIYECLLEQDFSAFLLKFEVFAGLVSSKAITLDQCRRVCTMQIQKIHQAIQARNRLLSGDRLAKVATAIEQASQTGEIIREIERYFLSICEILSIKQNSSLYQVEQVKNAVAALYAEPVSTQDIAQRVYLSEGYLRSFFKKHTGITVLDYLTQVRMEKARLLLNDPANHIYEVGKRVGLENTSYFCALFKKTYGVTPNEYRKK